MSLAALMYIVAVCISPVFAQATAESHIPDQQRLDSIAKNLPLLEQKVYSTLLFGGSSPVSITGEARIKGTYHLFSECPDFLAYGDRMGIIPSGGIRLGLVAQPSRNLVLWSKLGLTSKLTGNRVRRMDSTGSFSPTESHYYSENNPLAIFEDMAAGAAYTTSDVSLWLKLGAIIWTEASPLTIWKSEPRAFAWEYLEYEDEAPSSEYYKSNVEIGEKTGRAAWNKKAFNGINLESLTLPYDFYINLLYAKFPDYDPFEREYMDFSTDLGYAAEEKNPSIIETGYGDSYRHIFHARLAKKFNDLTLGANYNMINCSKDIIYAENPSAMFFNAMFNLQYSRGKPLWADEYKVVRTATTVDSIPLDCGKGFYKEPKVFSLDLKGDLFTHFNMHADVGFSRIDTTWVWGDTVKTDMEKTPLTVKKTAQTYSDLTPAVYTNLSYAFPSVTVTADMAYAKRGFYSPFSFISPMDAFYAFGTNCVGEGTFSAKTEASPYSQNMAGAQLTISPKVPGTGHFDIKYGQHFQPESARDLLFIPYRLNGMDLNSTITSSYNMDGFGTVDYPMAGKYYRRLGDESFDPQVSITGKPNDPNDPTDPNSGASGSNGFSHIEESPEKGGLHADYLSMFEGFVPYDDPVQLLLNIKSRRNVISRYRQVGPGPLGRVINDNGDTVTVTNPSLVADANGFVPMHKKYTGNLELDAAYDIGPLIHFPNKFYLAGYLAISSVTNAFKALTFNENGNEMLLWSSYYRFEPAIGLTSKFYLDILLGVENWRSNKAWMNLAVADDGTEDLENPLVKRVPMNYKDVAYGIGFDWDMLTRTALHFRIKKFTHSDANFTQNDYESYLTSLEITMFF